MKEPDWLRDAIAAAAREGRLLHDSAAAPPPAPSAAEPPRPAPTPARTRLAIEVEVSNLRLASEANTGGRLRDRIARKSAVKAAIRAALPRLADPVPLPCVVTITRLGGKELDEHDNLPRAGKACADVVAEWLGLESDRDARVTWRVVQKPAYACGVRIRIVCGG